MEHAMTNGWGVIGWNHRIVCYELIPDCQGGFFIEARVLGSQTLLPMTASMEHEIAEDARKRGIEIKVVGGSK